LPESERGREIFCYSVFTRKDGFNDYHIMESYHIDKIKAMVLARTPKSPWADAIGEPEMRKKTCLRRHWKLQPKSEEVAYSIEAEEAFERGETLKSIHPEIKEIMDEIIEKNKETENKDPISAAFDGDKEQ